MFILSKLGLPLTPADRYDRRWARYTARSLELLRPCLPEPPHRLLDVGCGTGALLRFLRTWGREPSRYLGVDLSAAMLQGAALHPAAGLARAEAGALPLAEGAFDLVVSSSSLHDWPHPDAALREIRRVIAPGGRLLLADWCADFASIRWMRAWLRVTGRPVRQVYTADGLQAALGRAGFRTGPIRRARISPVWGLMVAEARPT